MRSFGVGSRGCSLAGGVALAVSLAACAGAGPGRGGRGGAGVVKLSGGDGVLALRADGSVVGWGPWDRWWRPDKLARLAGDARERSGPFVLELPGPAADVAMGQGSAYVVLRDGRVMALGDASGLGRPTGGEGTSVASPVPGVEHAVQVVANVDSAIALLADGTLRTWGCNALVHRWFMPPGDCRTAAALAPVAIPGVSDVVQVALGSQHALALRRDGHVVAWGSNYFGALGRAPLRLEPVGPAEVPGLDRVSYVAVGRGVSLAVTADGSVWVWGRNDDGQFGNGERDLRGVNGGYQVVPQRVPMTGAVSGSVQTYALVARADGSVVGWGDNRLGQLGTTNPSELRPVELRVPPVVSVLVNGGVSYAVSRDGEVWAWGNGSQGRWPLSAPSLDPVRLALP